MNGINLNTLTLICDNRLKAPYPKTVSGVQISKIKGKHKS